MDVAFTALIVGLEVDEVSVCFSFKKEYLGSSRRPHPSIDATKIRASSHMGLRIHLPQESQYIATPKHGTPILDAPSENIERPCCQELIDVAPDQSAVHNTMTRPCQLGCCWHREPLTLTMC